MPPERELITAEEAAYYTGRPVGTIWRWASEGRITRVGTGKKARYHWRTLPPALENELGERVPAEAPPLPEGRKAA